MIICLHKGKGLVSGGIRFKTRGGYTHASILIDEDHVFEAREFKGVIISEIDPRDKIDYFHLEINTIQADKLVRFLSKQKGKGYDYWSIWAFITRAKEKRSSLNQWFCSELVFASVANIGIKLLHRIEPYKVDPNRLSLSPLIKQINKDEIDTEIDYYTSFNDVLRHWLRHSSGYDKDAITT